MAWFFSHPSRGLADRAIESALSRRHWEVIPQSGSLRVTGEIRKGAPDQSAAGTLGGAFPNGPRLVHALGLGSCGLSPGRLRVNARMGGLEFLGQAQHVVVLAADQPVAAHLARVRRGQAYGDGVGVDIQDDVVGRALAGADDGFNQRLGPGIGRFAARRWLGLDGVGGTEYVGLRVSVLRSFVVGDVSPTTPVLHSPARGTKDGCGSAIRLAARNPRLLRRADTASACMLSHTV